MVVLDLEEGCLWCIAEDKEEESLDWPNWWFGKFEALIERTEVLGGGLEETSEFLNAFEDPLEIVPNLC